MLFKSKEAQVQLDYRLKIWFLRLRVSNYFLYIRKCTYEGQKRKKNEVTFSFPTPVEAAILKACHRNLTIKFYCKQTALDISVRQISKTYCPNSTSFEPGDNIVLHHASRDFPKLTLIT